MVIHHTSSEKQSFVFLVPLFCSSSPIVTTCTFAPRQKNGSATKRASFCRPAEVHAGF